MVENNHIRKYGKKALHFGKTVIGLTKTKETKDKDTDIPDAGTKDNDNDDADSA